jgi:hypothetical protein
MLAANLGNRCLFPCSDLEDVLAELREGPVPLTVRMRLLITRGVRSSPRAAIQSQGKAQELFEAWLQPPQETAMRKGE